ncbi:hypothetical protein [Halobacillus salinarum]|nr:hypothetical protein [Halobacillus salinarum]
MEARDMEIQRIDDVGGIVIISPAAKAHHTVLGEVEVNFRVGKEN